MDLITHALHQNNEGVRLLALNRPTEAFDVLSFALDQMSKVAVATKMYEIQCGVSPMPVPAAFLSNSCTGKLPQEHFTSPIPVKMHPVLHQSMEDDCPVSICNHAVQIQIEGLQGAMPTSQCCELFMASISNNMALSFHQRAYDGHQDLKVTALRTALTLNYLTMQLIHACSGEFECPSLAAAVLNNVCVLHHELGERQQHHEVLTVLRSLFFDLELLSRTPEQKVYIGKLFHDTLLRMPYSAGAA